MLSQMSTMRMLYLGSIKPLKHIHQEDRTMSDDKVACTTFIFCSLLHLRGAGMIGCSA